MLRTAAHEVCVSSSSTSRHLHTSSILASQTSRTRSQTGRTGRPKASHLLSKDNFSREKLPHVGRRPVKARNTGYEPSAGGLRRPIDQGSTGETSWNRRMREEATQTGRGRVQRSDSKLLDAVRESIRLQAKPRAPEPITYHADPRSTRLSRPEKPKDAPAKKLRNDLLEREFSKEKVISDEVAQFSQSFTSPPLLPGLLNCLEEVIGPDATPTPIQASSLTWLLNTEQESESGWRQYLLASETGSGKSIAYLLPMLQHLKVAELERRKNQHTEGDQRRNPKLTRELMPRALILAPTHELARQLTKTAKSLLHEIKLRVRCVSQANTKSTKQRDFTARQLAAQLDAGDQEGTFEVKNNKALVDILVGTPMKVMDMYKGGGWNRSEMEAEEDGKPAQCQVRRSPKTPILGLENIEWVVVDEADVLFDPDFEQMTRQLLADISGARGKPVKFSKISSLSLENSSSEPAPVPTPIEYPFNFILTSATIPSALARYLDETHPKLLRLASPRLHALPKLLRTEYVGWTGGNKNADIERRLRQVWAEDSVTRSKRLSKVLIFCNKNSKIDDLAAHLEEKGIKTIALSRDSDQRKWGSNHHLDGFVKVKTPEGEVKEAPSLEADESDPSKTAHVMITTSLLSRGIDFSPSVKHVFIVDEPRNMIDFLHRAGRTGRAGEGGKVVIFGRMQGRGSLKAKEIRSKVNLLSMIR